MAFLDPGQDAAPWRRRLFVVIFGTETRLGRAFDVTLLVAILLSVLAAMLDSVHSLRERYGLLITAAEWIFTVLFTVEYALRLACVGRPLRYARSFFGVVDLLAILPTYLSLFVAGAETLIVIRGLRLLRVFRVLKLVRHLGEARFLLDAIRGSMAKVTVFLGAVLILMILFGTIMYLVEGEQSGFTSVPQGIYWAVVTMTTVGYGDIAPQTVLGRTLAASVMIIGYGIIAVPTGIVSAEFVNASRDRARDSIKVCPQCRFQGHEWDANYCKLCGGEL